MGHQDQGVGASRHRYQVIPRTLCFIRHGNDVLLLRGSSKKRLWAGLYNGVGGHIERGEDVYTAALREIREETGLAVSHLRLAAVVHADAGDPGVGILFFVFTAIATDRRVKPSSEGTLEWLPITDLPQTGMVEDLPTLLPKVLMQGPDAPPIFAQYTYDAEDRLVIRFAEPV